MRAFAIKAGVFAYAVLLLFSLTLAAARPDGVTIVPIRNETSTPSSAGLINTTGGTITIINITASTQNVRWKAFIGNVSGNLILEDSAGSAIYSWELASVTGEVYATRFGGTINWTGIGCANLTHISNEEVSLGHTNKDDNITRTFSQQTHAAFSVDVKQIAQNSCQSLHTYVNSTAQSDDFEEVILYDGTNLTNGNMVFGTILEQDIYGYNNKTYDFQMLVPERGEPTWTSATAYYFYVELT